jgi:hypothetical protein
MTENILGDAPVQEEYIDTMRRVVSALDKAFNGDAKGPDRKTGFILMVFPYGVDKSTDARCNYMSNGADRNDVIALMKEQIKRFEGSPDQKGHA